MNQEIYSIEVERKDGAPDYYQIGMKGCKAIQEETKKIEFDKDGTPTKIIKVLRVYKQSGELIAEIPYSYRVMTRYVPYGNA